MTAVSTVQLAANGPTFSRIVAGMMNLSGWQLAGVELLDWLHACLDMGITTFDHADIYGGYTCEEAFGRALALEPGLRQRMQIVTKCGIKLISPNRPQHTVHHYDTSAEHILASVTNSLRALHVDTIDLLLIHRPSPLLDADDVAQAFARLKAEGKVRHFGVSNFLPHQFDLLQSRLDFPLVTNQVELSPLQMNVLHNGTLDQCQHRRIAPMIWSPYAGGRIFRGEDMQSQRVRQTMRDIGDALEGASVAQVALAWIMAHPSLPLPILGTGKLERLQKAIEAESLALSREQWFTIWEASTGHEVP